MIVAQMHVIDEIGEQYKQIEQTYFTARAALNSFVKKHYGVDISRGAWSLDPTTGELTNALQGPDNRRPPDPDGVD